MDHGMPGRHRVDGRLDRLLLHHQTVEDSEEPMSRVHDALRRAENAGMLSPPINRANPEGRAAAATLEVGPNLTGLLEQVEEVPFRTAPDSLLLHVSRPPEAP